MRGIPDARACAMAPPLGEEARIAEEEAVIVWDPATRTEHFIRRAAFWSTSHSFGFLVPTPTTPQLGELPDSIYRGLGEQIRPEVRHEGGKVSLGSWLLEACMLTAARKGAVDGAAPPVRVIQAARVAGFDATTLEADAPDALAGWLGQHGFAATPALTAWLARYVTDKWKLTAFVVATDQAQGNSFEIATRAVDMAFHTDRPFYPYREPEAQPRPEPQDRVLRVYFLSNARYAATLGDQPWSARVIHAGPLAGLPAELAPLAGDHPFATVFIDDRSPRRGLEELYFAPSADTSRVRQPPIVITDRPRFVIPIEGIAIAFVWIARWLARRRRRARVHTL